LQWKTILYGVDAFNIKPFLDRAAATTNDLDIYDVCIDYITQFRDNGHVYFGVPSDFIANTGLLFDTYDNGRPLIYSINRTSLPVATYPFQIGDELVSIDGMPAADIMKSLAKYVLRSTPRTEQGYSAQYLGVRPQSIFPYAVDVPDVSQFVIKRQSGAVETYSIKWIKTGVPLLRQGPVSYPQLRPADVSPAPGADLLPPPLMSEVDPIRGVTGVGALRPIFNLPADFKIRLGSNPNTDAFYSGTYQSNGYTIGFIRIPTFGPSLGIPYALAQFQNEVAFFNANTDGLIIDDMRNNGGTIYYGEDIARRLITVPFHLVGFELRATSEWIRTYSSYYQYVQAIGAPQWQIDNQTLFLNIVKTAYSQNGGHTGPLPLDTIALTTPPDSYTLDTTPALDRSGNPVGYTKPMMVLTDEFSFSTADMFPAIMQDNQAATIYGMHTGGLGGTNAAYNAGAFSEATVGMLRGMMYRKNPVVVSGFPTSYYIENIGVQPDIVDDYKTLDNLLRGGATFVSNFTAAMVKKIQASR
jgi:Peptidase family S41/PDZ domain